ncbi:zinc metalloproteinase nas-4-like [Argiope bruennichi]|uniref:zinc metalloproteinase nas-4-like n=1 Tax=Argiope bruennichi TaxID=94029 RepID=UPI0024959E31|nr:zinc metalloproteinase nas-4-like [Argiope bruennichi]
MVLQWNRVSNLKPSDSKTEILPPGHRGVRGRIVVALAAFELARNTCIRLVQRTNETDYVSLFRGDGCYSMVGRMGGEQKLSLASGGCDQVGIVIHEFMHALGFWHEQSRVDRDNYVTIRWENIQPGTENNFQKYNTYIQQTLDEEYDYASLLHYSRRAFSRNSLATVEPKNFVGNFIIGQRLGLSPTDIRKINKLYNCSQYL